MSASTSLTDEIKSIAARDDTVRRLMTVPGIGELGATAIVAAVGDGKQFRKGRDMAAWLGAGTCAVLDRGQSKPIGD